jgi:hypothetical protein
MLAMISLMEFSSIFHLLSYACPLSYFYEFSKLLKQAVPQLVI